MLCDRTSGGGPPGRPAFGARAPGTPEQVLRRSQDNRPPRSGAVLKTAPLIESFRYSPRQNGVSGGLGPGVKDGARPKRRRSQSATARIASTSKMVQVMASRFALAIAFLPQPEAQIAARAETVRARPSNGRQ